MNDSLDDVLAITENGDTLNVSIVNSEEQNCEKVGACSNPINCEQDPVDPVIMSTTTATKKVQIQEFSVANPSLWFLTTKTLFRVNGIKEEIEKFGYLLQGLSMDQLEKIQKVVKDAEIQSRMVLPKKHIRYKYSEKILFL